MGNYGNKKTDYTYDFKGNITSMIDYKFDGNDSISYHYTYYEYDLNGKMTGYSEINASSKPSDGAINNHKLVYKYDVEGNITEIVYPTSLNDGITSIKFEYNEYNWITGIKAKINSVYKELRDYIYNSDGTINNIKDYTYDTNSNVNGYILKKYTYDNFGRVSSMKYYNSDSDTVKESYTYTYDKNSNIKSESIVNNYPTKDSDKVDEKRSYEYDKLNRLINSDIVNNKTNKTESYAYEYDKVGNMISKSNILSDTNNITDYTYNDLNQLVSSETSNLSTGKTTSKKTYSYDENGNNIKEVDSIKNITKEMTYDVDNRLDTYTQTENNKTTTQSNLYNGDGQRIQKTEGDNSINYYYQNGNVLYTTDKDEKKTSHNFVGLEGNTISTMRYNISGLEYYVYNKDVKGSTTNIVDNNKNAKISYKYSDFGETREIGDTDFYNEIAYTGGIYDESTSLYYLNARYYNPEDARFITQDTYRGEVNNPSSLHLYAYCTNNPINYVDPTGHWVTSIGIAVGISVVYKYENFVGIAISSNKTFGLVYTRVDGLEFGGFSFGATVQINVYPSNNTIKSLSGKSFNAGATINTTVVNVSGGVSIGLENKNKGITPSVSGNVGGVVRFSTPINVYVTHSKTETLQFPFSIDSFLKRPKNTKKQYSFRGSKITLKNKNKKFIELNSNKMYGKIYSNKKVYIYKK
ncbi:MAG: RHS repeat domain-containing protein [Intestinibacter bartlettii]